MAMICITPETVENCSDTRVGLRWFHLAIIGGGPAGLAPLLAAHRVGRLDEMLDAGVVVIERTETIGAGAIGDYSINSDSTGLTFFDCLRGVSDSPLTALQGHPLAQAMEQAGHGPVPLTLVGQFMRLVGSTLAAMVSAHPRCAVMTCHTATAIRQIEGGWSVATTSADGAETTLSARFVISATGAHQPQQRLEREVAGGVRLSAELGAKLWQSGDVVSLGGLERVAEKLAGLENPRVAVLGGSTSAVAVAYALLNRLPSIQFRAGGVSLLHRRELQIYYPSVAEAAADGFTDYTEADICPISQRVFRFAGLRLDSRELVMQARGVGGRSAEPRLRLHRLQADDAQARAILDEADLVIAAFGYRPFGVTVLDSAGQTIELLANTSPQAPLVDRQCRVLDAQGGPIGRLFGIGLAAGFVPSGKLGGEPSFRGQANGLWLWQTDVGLLIVESVLETAETLRVAA